jgi:hypothetical protein
MQEGLWMGRAHAAEKGRDFVDSKRFDDDARGGIIPDILDRGITGVFRHETNRHAGIRLPQHIQCFEGIDRRTVDVEQDRSNLAVVPS